MPCYLKYQTDDGDTILVEVERDLEITEEGVLNAGRVGEKVRNTVEDMQTRFEDAMDTIRYNAQTIIGKVKELSERPDEVEVAFGLKATGEMGNFAIAKASAEANYTVKMVWKREQEKRGRRKTKRISRRRHFLR